MQDFAYTISKFFWECYPWTLSEAPPVLGPRTNFRLARQHSNCSCFMKLPPWAQITKNLRKKLRLRTVGTNFNQIFIFRINVRTSLRQAVDFDNNKVVLI